MKWILKKSQPYKLALWCSIYENDINFGYDLLRQDHEVANSLLASLLEEQGYLCAYTGISIDQNKAHIEHLKPQTHCVPKEEVDYRNVVACFPDPNRSAKLPYGAEFKDQWPHPNEQHLFLSPLDQTCETRFFFDLKGKISCTKGDKQAETTIEKLGLDHKYLKEWRRSEIQGVIGVNNDLRLSDARKRLTKLKAQQTGPFDQFCFVLIQALEKHIRRVEKIAKYGSKAGKNRK